MASMVTYGGGVRLGRRNGGWSVEEGDEGLDVLGGGGRTCDSPVWER